MSNDHRWVFGEAFGLVANDLIGSINGTVSGDMVWGTPGRYGLGGRIITKATLNAYVDFGTPIGQFGTDVFTVMFWMQTSDKPALIDLCGNRIWASNGNFFGVRMNASGAVIAEVDEDQNGTNYAAAQSTGAPVNDGAWHHVAVVRSGPVLQLYIDGVQNGVGIGTAAANINTNATFRLGASAIAVGTAGIIYTDLCIFRDQLSADEISHIFHFH